MSSAHRSAKMKELRANPAFEAHRRRGQAVAAAKRAAERKRRLAEMRRLERIEAGQIRDLSLFELERVRNRVLSGMARAEAIAEVLTLRGNLP